ncbi:hypothetical protein D023_4490A, partial [Vibrio parahaemolyticus 3256]
MCRFGSSICSRD